MQKTAADISGGATLVAALPGSSAQSGVRPSSVFGAVVVLSAVYLLATNFSVGVAYLACATALVVPLWSTSVSDRSRYVLLFIAASLFITYLLQPVILAYSPQFYTFGYRDPITAEKIAATLWNLATYFWAFFGGVWLVTASSRDSQLQSIASQQFTRVACRSSTLVRAKSIVIAASFAVLITRAALALKYGVGVKLLVHAQSPGLAFLTRLLPDTVCVVCCTMLLLAYRRHLSKAQVIAIVFFLLGNGVLEIACGSKAGILEILFTILVVRLMRRNDAPIKGAVWASIAVALLIIVPISMVAATSIRWSTKKSARVLTGVSSGLATLHDPQVSDGLLLAAGRVSAFDQHSFLLRAIPPGMRDAYTVENVAGNFVARLVPFVQPSAMTLARASGIWLYGLDSGFGASVGLFATLQLLFGVGALPATLLLGGMAIGGVRVLGRIRDTDVRTLSQFFFLLFLLRLTMSGAFDQLLADLVIVSVQGMAFLYLCRSTGGSTYVS